MKGERALVRGTVDGCLSVLGVVIGAYGMEPALLLSAALAGNMANGLSNVLAAFSAESAHAALRLRILERAMLTELHGTEAEQVTRTATLRAAISDGLATVLGGLVPVLPFFFFSGLPAMGLAIGMSLLVMLGLGAWAGRLSHQGMLRSALKLAAWSLLTVLTSLAIPRLVAPEVPLS
ncbi:MAG: TIGR00267 family protein [Candidatus Tectimicrobiota bacterium]|nr:MAG: TIGR00267 family protein [Candidatus Tectomicrobia bacterium]